MDQQDANPPDSTPADTSPHLAPPDLMLIVVGAHLRAEIADRPLAAELRRRVLERQTADGHDGPAPVLCTDLWYLNNRELLRRPTVCLGAPEVNAATAYLGSRLPTSLVIEDTLRIQLDPDFVDLRACLWGVDTASTGLAVRLFDERYLEAFLGHAV